MTTTKALPVAMRLICDAPLPERHDGRPAESGLQDKKQALHLGTRLSNGSIGYDFSVTVERKPNQAMPKFGGPFVHGTAAAPFLYVSYREAQAGSPWIRRLKIHLSSITWAQVEAALASNAVIEGHISGQGSATVPLLGDGWIVRQGES